MRLRSKAPCVPQRAQTQMDHFPLCLGSIQARSTHTAEAKYGVRVLRIVLDTLGAPEQSKVGLRDSAKKPRLANPKNAGTLNSSRSPHAPTCPVCRTRPHRKDIRPLVFAWLSSRCGLPDLTKQAFAVISSDSRASVETPMKLPSKPAHRTPRRAVLFEHRTEREVE
jgi:hypothetical protein